MLKMMALTLIKLKYISLICDNTVTTQNVWFFRRKFKGFEVL